MKKKKYWNSNTALQNNQVLLQVREKLYQSILKRCLPYDRKVFLKEI